MKGKTTYIIYYVDKDGESQGYDVAGLDGLKAALRWLKSDEGVLARKITVFKRGKNFASNQDDVVEMPQYSYSR